MRFAALFAAVALAAACGVAPDPDSLSKPRIEQIQPAAFHAEQRGRAGSRTSGRFELQ